MLIHRDTEESIVLQCQWAFLSQSLDLLTSFAELQKNYNLYLIILAISNIEYFIYNLTR